MKGKLNNIWLGAVLGLLFPAITIIVVWLIRFDYMEIGEFITTMMARKLLSAIISLCAIPNFLVFLVFIWLNYLYSARGVLMSTLIVAVIMIIVKFLL